MVQPASKIERLKVLEGEDKSNNARRWEAAHLYWRLSREDDMTQVEIAEQIGKSQPYVSYMIRTWQVTVVDQDLVCTYGSLFKFNDVFVSPEVRGESARPKSDSKPTGAQKKSKDDDDDDDDDELGNSAHDHVTAAARSIAALANNRAYDVGLDEADVTTLTALIPAIRRIVRRLLALTLTPRYP